MQLFIYLFIDNKENRTNVQSAGNLFHLMSTGMTALNRVHLDVRTYDIFFFVSSARAEVWSLFNGLMALFFSLFHIIREFHRFLHRG